MDVSGWRQFDHVNLEFHPSLTVLTGANATGKSTLLGILARHFNWHRPYSTAPVSSKGRITQWSPLDFRIWKRDDRKRSSDPHWQSIGNLTYGTGITTQINVPVSDPQQTRSQYDLLLTTQQAVNGAYITSHRPVSGNYSHVSSIPTEFADPNALSDQYTNEVRNQWAGGYTGKTPQLVLKESLIAAAAFGGRGNQAMDYNEDADSIWSGFQQVLSHVIPPAIGFRRIRARVPDLIIETKSGDFIFDDASGGLAAVIDVAWQIFLRSRTYSSFTVLLDEPENHLHPSLQREIIPSLLRAFPNVQFIVATHSPFVVTATPDSSVYALDYGPNGLVYSRNLDYVNKAASADETLRRVLGVESTMPAWAETKFSQIVSEYMHSLLNDERLRALRNELKANGLETEFPDAVLRLTDNFGDDRTDE